MTHLEPGGRGIIGKWKWRGIDLEEAKSAQRELVKESSTWRNSNCVLSPFPRPPPLPHEQIMYQKASICVTHWYFSKHPWMFFLGHHKLLPRHDFLTHPSLFQAKLPTKKKKKHKVTQIYGSWFKSRRRKAVWSSRGRGDGEGPEQKATLRRKGKADGRQGFFLEGRHSSTARMSQVSANPPTAQSPRGGGQSFPGALSKPSLCLRLKPHR